MGGRHLWACRGAWRRARSGAGRLFAAGLLLGLFLQTPEAAVHEWPLPGRSESPKALTLFPSRVVKTSNDSIARTANQAPASPRPCTRAQEEGFGFRRSQLFPMGQGHGQRGPAPDGKAGASRRTPCLEAQQVNGGVEAQHGRPAPEPPAPAAAVA